MPTAVGRFALTYDGPNGPATVQFRWNGEAMAPMSARPAAGPHPVRVRLLPG